LLRHCLHGTESQQEKHDPGKGHIAWFGVNLVRQVFKMSKLVVAFWLYEKKVMKGYYLFRKVLKKQSCAKRQLATGDWRLATGYLYLGC
jgi:hypothetical protein